MHQVPQDPPPSRSHRTGVSLHMQPFVSPIPDWSRDRPDQMAHRRESRRTPLESEHLCRNRCAAFPVPGVSCRIAEFLLLRTKHCSHPSGLCFRTLSSEQVFHSQRKLPRRRRNRLACMSLRKSPESTRRALKWRASALRLFREVLVHRTSNQFASQVVFRRQLSPRSSRRDNPHTVRLYEILGNAAAATGG